jgi:phosphate acetyltransferase
MKEFMKGIKEKARADPKRIVFAESTEERTLKAIETIIKEKTAIPVLIGAPDVIWSAIHSLNLNIPGDRVTVVDHLAKDNTPRFDRYAGELYDLRKEKGLTLEQAKDLLKEEIYYGTMMVHLNDADGLISGALHTTAHTVRPALQIIKCWEPKHIVSGMFFMDFKDRVMLFADSAVTIDPNAEQLAEIALDTAISAKEFGFKPRVALLSFSTKGSADHPMAKKVQEATAIAKERAKKLIPEAVIDGELQLDAAVRPEVAKLKCPDSLIQGDANVLVFPDLNSGNIGYKLVNTFGHASAIGPVLQGLKKPVNDLSRGCVVQEIIDMAAITVVQAQNVSK